MVTWYELWLTLHALAAAVWTGGILTSQLVAERAARARDEARLRAWADDAAWLATRVYLPAALVLLALGFVLVEDGHWTYRPVFVQSGFAILGFSVALGVLWLPPAARRLATAEPDDARRRVRRIVLVSRVELALLLVALLFMFVKPWD